MYGTASKKVIFFGLGKIEENPNLLDDILNE